MVHYTITIEFNIFAVKYRYLNFGCLSFFALKLTKQLEVFKLTFDERLFELFISAIDDFLANISCQFTVHYNI